MDIIIYALSLLAPLVLMVMAVVNRSADGVAGFLLAGLSALGGIIGIWGFLAVGSDGSITQVSNGVATVIATSNNPATWQVVTLVSLVFTGSSFMVAMYRGYKSF